MRFLINKILSQKIGKHRVAARLCDREEKARIGKQTNQCGARDAATLGVGEHVTYELRHVSFVERSAVSLSTVVLIFLHGVPLDHPGQCLTFWHGCQKPLDEILITL